MRRYSVWVLMICLLLAYSAIVFANKFDRDDNHPKQFVSLRKQAAISGFKIYSQEKSATVLASYNNNILYIDSSEGIGWLNNKKLLINQDFTVNNSEILISRNLLNELLQKPQVKKNAAKKVFALYQGYRRTRLQDGDLGGWKVFYKTEKSKTGTKYINFNPDIIDQNGHHEVASSNGVPIVGIQSDTDPDYIEYNILLAKTASVDGFIIDYVFPEYPNTILIKNYINVAKKYDFEIGVDWLDASVYANWIQNYSGYEDIKSRDQKTEYAKYALRYAWENFYSQSTAAKFNNRPLFFIFGGATSDELKTIISSNKQINDSVNPIYIRRSQLWGKAIGKDVIWDDLKDYYPKWHNIDVDIFSWKATCVRPTTDNSKYSKWDKYASWEDNFDFAKQYEQMWQSDKKVNVNTACVWPGFDDRACAGWGNGTFSVIDRKNGTLYRSLWDYYLQHKSLIDIVFIASWSDFTEGHEIAPTVKNGYREILSTLEFANKFKGNHDNDGTEPIYYPEKIFRLRKLARKYQEIGLKTVDCQQLLDIAALAVSRRDYQSAGNVLQKIMKRLDDAQSRIDTKKIHLRLDNNDFSIINSNDDVQHNNDELSGPFGIVLPQKIINLLRDHYYEGFLNFSYYGDNFQKFQITSDTSKNLPQKFGLTQGSYSVIADITKNSSSQWEKCKVALYAENIKLAPTRNDKGDIRFSGNARIKDLSIDITYYEIENRN